MRRPILAAALAIVFAATPGTAPLQAQAPADSGTRVRVLAPPVRGTYRLVGTSSDTLLLQRDPASPVQRVPMTSIQRFDVSRGRRSTGAGIARGFFLGAGIGAGVGIAAGLASGSDDGEFLAMSAGEKAAAGGLVAGLAGGVVGGLIGALGPGERWERVDPRGIAVVGPPAGRGVGLRLAGAF